MGSENQRFPAERRQRGHQNARLLPTLCAPAGHPPAPLFNELAPRCAARGAALPGYGSIITNPHCFSTFFCVFFIPGADFPYSTVFHLFSVFFCGFLPWSRGPGFLIFPVKCAHISINSEIF
jgi:hypothetical protein